MPQSCFLARRSAMACTGAISSCGGRRKASTALDATCRNRLLCAGHLWHAKASVLRQGTFIAVLELALRRNRVFIAFEGVLKEGTSGPRWPQAQKRRVVCAFLRLRKKRNADNLLAGPCPICLRLPFADIVQKRIKHALSAFRPLTGLKCPLLVPPETQ